MELIEGLKDMITQLGVGGIFLATALEYGCFPISSEILLPFIGYIVAGGGFSLFFAILAATAGGLVGTTACYLLGRVGGGVFERLSNRFESVNLGVSKAQGLFLKYGRESVFFARLFPIARTYISFPAGMAKMPYLPFILYTGAGVVLWNTALISVGYFLGNHWEMCKTFLGTYQNELLGLLVLGVVFIFWRKRRRK